VNPQLRFLLGIVGMAAAYVITGTLAFSLHALGGVATLIWAPGAIGLSICLLYGLRWWPGVALGTIALILVRGFPLLPGIVVAAIDVGEVVLACLFLRGLIGFRPELDRVRDVVSFVEVCFGVTLLGVTTTLAVFFAMDMVSLPHVTDMWGRWWWSHFSADLIIAPAILTCARRARRCPYPRLSPNRLEAVALTLTVLFVVLIVLGRWLPPWLPASNAPYYLLPMLLWAGVRFGPRGAALATLGASIMAMIAQSFGVGPFSRLFEFQTFVGISTISTLMLSALAMERVRAVERKGAIQLAALDGIITIDNRGRVTELNPAAERLFGLRAEDAIGKDLADLVIPPHYRDAFHRGLRAYVKTGAGNVGSRYRAVAWRASDNKEFPVEIAITRVPIEDEFLVTGFIRDLTMEREAEIALERAHDELERKVEERTAALVAANRELERRDTLMRQAEELAHLGSFDYDLKTKKLKWSDELYRIYGRDVGTFEPSYDAFLGPIHEDDRTEIRARIDKATTSPEDLRPFAYEERIVRPDGTQRWLQTLARVFVDDVGHPVRLAGCCQDITERKQGETVRSRFKQLVESSDDAMIGLSPDGRIETWNPAATQLFGYAGDDVKGHESSLLVPEQYARQLEDLLANVRLGERIPPYEMAHRRKDGSVFEASVTTSAVLDRRGQIVGISQVLRDVSKQKKVEMQIRASLEEKEVLLREIHHRVKNNLQVIASLLNIQVSSEPTDGAKKGLVESQNRIQSMALVHQLLYQSKDLAQIDAGQYLTNLTNRLVASYNIAPERIAVHVFSSPLLLDIDRAIPCGLIVNELVTNALTHAFPNQRRGQVWVALERHGDTATLTVSDDGVGIPPELDLADVHTFGLRIANTLALQLDGRLSLTRELGTTLRVEFPIAVHQMTQAA